MSPRLALLCFVSCLLATPSAAGAEKREKWLELDSPHFVVFSNAGEKQAGRAADQLEAIRAVFHRALPRLNVDPSMPIVVLAAKDEKTFRVFEPEAWLAKGHLKIAGMFMRSPEKNQVLLRLDTEGLHPYETVYHEYTHLLIEQNVGTLEVPLWLNEGLAEFYGNSEIREKEVWLGQPNEGHLLLLHGQRLVPLATLFTVDRFSPYYNEQTKGSIFYAESWALTHLLMIRSYESGKNPLGDFLALVAQNVEPTAAATRAFGDLAQLQKELEAYVRQNSFVALKMKGATDADRGAYRVRELSAVESAVARSDFLIGNQRYSEAHELLDEALHEQPDFAPAHEALGLLEFRQGRLVEAKKRFEEAVKLDSRSFFAHYYYAVMTMEENRGAASGDVETSLRKAIRINPRFGPAYNALASFYGLRGEHLDEAHRLSLQAVELEPGNVNYFITVASILMRQNRAADAIHVAERARPLAKTPEESAGLQSLLESARQYQDYLDAQAKVANQAQASIQERRTREAAEREAEGKKVDSEPPEVEAVAPKPTPAEHLHEPGATPPGRRDLVEGAVAEVRCSSPQVMKLTLALTGYKLELHSANYYQVEFTTDNWVAPSPFNPCRHLRGMRARVVFSIEPKNQGEIISVNVRGPGTQKSPKQN